MWIKLISVYSTAMSNIMIYLGRQSQLGSNSHETVRTVIQLIVHPNYNPSTNDNDIALLQLSSSVDFTDYIQPVCLAATGSVFNEGNPSWVTGWGDLYGSKRTLFPNVKHYLFYSVQLSH